MKKAAAAAENTLTRPLRARSALACSTAGQRVDGFTPSRGIRCEVAGNAPVKTKMNPSGLSSGVGCVKDATKAVNQPPKTLLAIIKLRTTRPAFEEDTSLLEARRGRCKTRL